MKVLLFLILGAVVAVSPCFSADDTVGLKRECCNAYLCPRHFRQSEKVSSQKTCSSEEIDACEPLLHLIPRPYTSDCAHCRSCGSPVWCGPKVEEVTRKTFDRRRQVWITVTESQCFWVDFDYLVSYVERDGSRIAIVEFVADSPTGNLCNCPKIYPCPSDSEDNDNYRNWEKCQETENFATAWDCGYFDLDYHQYFRFFQQHLLYCSQNPACRELWPELGGKAKKINNAAYRCFEKLCRTGLLDEDYWPSWNGLNTHGQTVSLVTYLYFYSQYHTVCADICSYINKRAILGISEQEGIGRVYAFLDGAHENFLALYSKCITNHPHPKLYYERGLVYFHRGDFQKAARDIQKFIEYAEQRGLEECLTSELYHTAGEMYYEAHRYDRAIEYLTRAILKDPECKEAHLSRAACYLELGDLDHALEDFFNSGEQDKPIAELTDESNLAFAKGFLQGVNDGIKAGLTDFIPSMLASVKGIGKCLWALAPLPGFEARAHQIGKTALEAIEYIHNTTPKELAGELAPEIRDLLATNRQELSKEELGRRVGVIVGKYGIEIFSGKGVTRLTRLVSHLRRVNCTATLVAASSSVGKEVMIARTAEQAARREAIVRKGHWIIDADKEGKHIKDHKFYDPDRRRSILHAHIDRQDLVHKHAGMGHPEGKKAAGTAGYKESIDFEQEIGLWWDADAKVYVPTSRGTIHYAEKKCHVVPARPRDRL
jgi:tetratricopeptide (TPR) repeat protein